MMASRSADKMKREVVPFALSKGQDLYEELTRLAVRHRISNALVLGIGALQRGVVAFYDQKTRRYEEHVFDEPMEILCCTGNVALKDGRPFVHVHVALSDRRGRAFGGHVRPGCVVFACEGFLRRFRGRIERRFDAATGLYLWRL